jgi:hypothetical protein
MAEARGLRIASESTMTSKTRRLEPAIAVAAITAATFVAICLEGHRLWCRCGHFNLWTSSAWSMHTSQHLFDPYTFTHLLHGIGLWWLLAWLLGSMQPSWRLAIAASIEALWEVVENSPFIIEKFRTQTAAADYHGDSAANSLGDLLACVAGFWLASRIGWRWSALLFAVSEVTLLLTIHDSLLLCVAMLIYPSEALRAWQAGG